MINEFADFTTIFFAFVALIAFGIIFEKQIIAIEDRFDAWVEKIRKSRNG